MFILELFYDGLKSFNILCWLYQLKCSERSFDSDGFVINLSNFVLFFINKLFDEA